MKSEIKRSWLIVLGLVVAIGPSHAQIFTTLRSFGVLTNVTGAQPYSQLVQGADGTLYGTTVGGEGSVAGTVFKVQPDGSGFTVLKWFTNSIEGANPRAGLALSGSVLYGTTADGGVSGKGTVFKLNTDGTGYAVLYSFAGTPDGADPQAGLTLSGSVLYGTTVNGGSQGYGTVFQLNTDGTGYTVLYSFAGTPDGANPYTGLTLSGGVLYGTTGLGGGSDDGTVFQLNTDGTGYTVLYSFAGTPDGAKPLAGLTLVGSILYGTTDRGGTSDLGTVFQLNTDGTGYNVLYNFAGTPDGLGPEPGLTLSGRVLYGTTYGGGSSSFGTVFKLNTDGTGYSVLYNFTDSPDGRYPYAGLTLSGSVLYGTASGGGTLGNGTVFRLSTDGTGFTVLKNFAFRSDAARPYAGLTLSGRVLYGTTWFGTNDSSGTVFKINTDGTAYQLLKDFNGSDGANPYTGLTLVGGALYGTTANGGASGNGTVFKLNTDGTGYTVLYNFAGTPDGSGPYTGLTSSGSLFYGTTFYGGASGNGMVFKLNTDGTGYSVLHNFTGSDGRGPQGGVTLSGSVLYGTTPNGGVSGNGTVFKLNTDGTGYSVLHNFTGSDGNGPEGGVTLSGSVLYGTTPNGGVSGNGTVFKVNTNGTRYTILHSFAGSPDGAIPSTGLTLVGSVLYGTTSGGGGSGGGTVFRLNTDGTDYVVLYNFTGALDGWNPSAVLTYSDGVLYGTTVTGGSCGDGTIFSISLPIVLPQLAITSSGANVILAWPTNATGFTLQSASNLGPTAVWVTNSVAPIVVNGQFTVTNPISGAQQFYRLAQ